VAGFRFNDVELPDSAIRHLITQLVITLSKYYSVDSIDVV
jgi:hypothetical protein